MHGSRVTGFSLLVIVALLSACKKDPPASLFDPNYVSGLQPTISSLVPADSGLSGVTVVTITGTNFSGVKENNIVYFNSKQAAVLQASATQLVVHAPDVPKDTVWVKVAVFGSELFSEQVRYKLIPAVLAVGAIPNAVEEPIGIDCDSSGNVYVSMVSGGGGGLGVKKLSPTNKRDSLGRTDYSPPFNTTINRWTAMKVGPGGFIYTAANRNAIFRIPAGGGASAPWASVAGAGLTSVFDLDFDQQGNIWAGGDNTALVRVKPDRSALAFPFLGDVRSVRVYNNYLYVATKNDSVWNIWRMRIFSSDSLGARENYFAFSGRYGVNGPGAYAITFSTDGDMFVGTDSLAGTIVLVHPDKSSEPFYPGLLGGRVSAFAYGKSTELYFSSTGSSDANKKVIRVFTQKQGAPYYGRQ
jgi:hypothetical protein